MMNPLVPASLFGLIFVCQPDALADRDASCCCQQQEVPVLFLDRTDQKKLSFH
jgi:hypothetical protein